MNKLPEISQHISRRASLSRGVKPAVGICAAGFNAEPAGQPAKSVFSVACRSILVDKVEVFYREADPPNAPVLLLLHGFPNSSHYFRDLMLRLADKFRLIAPDFPAFGFTTVHADASYRYSFAQMANTLGAFVDALGLKRYAMYVFDYGAPIGFRHALMRPERITGIISQNGNVYEEGLGEEMWKPVREYWREPTAKRREGIRDRLTFEGVKQAYLLGAARFNSISSWIMPRMLPCIRSSNRSFAGTSLQPWRSGAIATHFSYHPVRKHSAEMFLAHSLRSSMRVTLRWRPMWTPSH